MADPRERLAEYYRLLRQHGYNDSHSGNASVRVDDTVWLTPTGASGDHVTAADMVAAAVDGDAPAGASLDAPAHLAIYRSRGDVGAVLHSHGPHAIALSLDGTDFRPVDFEGHALFPRVPVLDVPWHAHVEAAPRRLAAALADHRVVILRGHGVYARGRDLDEAYRWNCQVEASARIAWLARGRGGG